MRIIPNHRKILENEIPKIEIISKFWFDEESILPTILK
jgi:hypothetical protein